MTLPTAIIKFSEISHSVIDMTATDFLLAVQNGNTDVLFSTAQIFNNIGVPVSIGGDNVNIGGFGRLEVIDDGSSNWHQAWIGYGNNADGIGILFAKTRAASASAFGTAAVINGDPIAQFRWRGDTGVTNANAAALDVFVDGVVGPGSVTGRMVFSTSPVGGGLVERMLLDSNGTLFLTPSPNSLTQAVNIGQTISGTGAAYTPLNRILINSDNAKMGVGGCVMLDMPYLLTGGDTGFRQGFDIELRRTGASDVTNTLYQDVGFTSAFNGQCNNNGTGPGANARGNGYGGFSVATLTNNATHWVVLTGYEIDIGVDSTSSAEYVIGFRIAHTVNHATKGVSYDTALDFADATGAIGWDSLITSSNVGGQFPLAATGTFIRTFGAQTFANGIDFSSATITGNFLAGPGFVVTGAGETQTQVLKTTTALVVAVDGGLTAAFTANMVGATGGPAAAAQNGWVKMKDNGGNTIWIPVWK